MSSWWISAFVLGLIYILSSNRVHLTEGHPAELSGTASEVGFDHKQDSKLKDHDKHTHHGHDKHHSKQVTHTTHSKPNSEQGQETAHLSVNPKVVSHQKNFESHSRSKELSGRHKKAASKMNKKTNKENNARHVIKHGSEKRHHGKQHNRGV